MTRGITCDVRNTCYGRPGVTPRVIRHVFQVIEQLRKKAKPGEKTEVGQRNTGIEGQREGLMWRVECREGQGCMAGASASMHHMQWRAIELARALMCCRIHVLLYCPTVYCGRCLPVRWSCTMRTCWT